MAFSGWDTYTGLLNKLADAQSNWSGAADFAEFDENIRQNCAALVPNSGGYAELVTRLDESGDYANEDKLFEHLRIVIFAEPANVAELGEDWTGYWISIDGDGAGIYAESRTAATSAWAALADPGDTDESVGPDETEPPAADAEADPHEQQFDEDYGRWRRWSDDGEYEYYHDSDDVWERVLGELFSRHHGDAQEWLPYDEPSKTWLYQNTWVAYDLVGAPDTTALPAAADEQGDDGEDEDLAALAERLVAETLADVDEDTEPLTDDERAEAVATVLRELEKERS